MKPIVDVLGPNIAPGFCSSEIFPIKYHYWINTEFSMEIVSKKRYYYSNTDLTIQIVAKEWQITSKKYCSNFS